MDKAPTLQINFTREALASKYREVLLANPLLARMEGECLSLGWTSEEIVKAQLLIACASNASLLSRLKEYEILLGQKTG